jgi:hypothetical protein
VTGVVGVRSVVVQRRRHVGRFARCAAKHACSHRSPQGKQHCQ